MVGSSGSVMGGGALLVYSLTFFSLVNYGNGGRLAIPIGLQARCLHRPVNLSAGDPHFA